MSFAYGNLTYFSQKLLAHFQPILNVSCRSKIIKSHQYNAGHMTKMAVISIYGKNTLKICLPETTGPILMKLCMKHQRPKPFIIYANNYDGLTLTYFTARPNLATKMDSLEIIASCALEFG